MEAAIKAESGAGPGGPRPERGATDGGQLLVEIAVHELRSPLTVIQGYASLLASGDLGLVDGAASRALRVISVKAREAQEIAATLLTAVRLDSDDLRMDSRSITVGPLLESIRDRSQPRAELAGATIAVSCPPDLHALGDSGLVARIVDNLVNNALSYSDTPAAVSLSATRSDGRIALRVSDQGLGIPEGERERIFGRFVRGAGAERTSGTGLGLYVSRECARRMGGELAQERTRPGEGSTFVLSLPAA